MNTDKRKKREPVEVLEVKAHAGGQRLQRAFDLILRAARQAAASPEEDKRGIDHE